MRNFDTREEAFQQLVREGARHETVTIGLTHGCIAQAENLGIEPEGVRYTHDERHPDSIGAAKFLRR